MTQETIKKVSVLFFVAILSVVSVFGIYNTFSFNVISMISGLPTIQDKLANGAILAVFTATAFYLNTVYTKNKGAGEVIKVGAIAISALCIIAGLMVLSSSVIYPLISMVIVGITVMLFKMMFETVGVTGVFGILALLIAAPVLEYKSSVDVDGTTMLFILQTIVAIVVFIGATYQRLRVLLFQVRTVNNVELSSNGPDEHEHNHH